MRSTFGKAPLSSEGTTNFTREEIRESEIAIERARELINKTPGSAIVDGEVREWQVQIAMTDSLTALGKIIPEVQKTKSLLGIESRDIKKLVPMMNLQYQLRTGGVLPQDPTAELLEGENDTARQIRLSYTKLMSFEK